MTLPREVQAVVFDMDGLLIDTEVVARDCFFETAMALGHEVPMSVYVQMIGVTGGGGRAAVLAHFGRDFPIEPLWQAWEVRFKAMTAAGVALKAGVVELLDCLDLVGLGRAIATSSSHDSVASHIGHHGILQRFDAVIARGDYERGKPHPDPFLAAAAALGVAPEHCLALEDSHNGVRAAHAAGMMTVMVPDLLEPTDEIGALCVKVADSLHDVRAMIVAQSKSKETA